MQDIMLDKIDWRKGIWLDEAKVQYVTYQPGRKVEIQPEEELLNRNLSTSFKFDSMQVGFWATIAYGKWTPLISTGRHTPTEQTGLWEHLDTNAT